MLPEFLDAFCLLNHDRYHMSLAEILDQLPKLTEQERETIRKALDLQKEEDEAIDEGFQSLAQEPPVAWPDVDRQIQQKHGWT
jgi:hypothetical protein